MFQGKCKVWREGDEVHASMMLPTPEGPVEWKETIKEDFDRPGLAERKMEAKAAFVAGFFPTNDMVGGEAMEEAESIYGSYLDPSSRNAAYDRLTGADHDTRYALNRIVGARMEEIGANFFKKAAKKLKGAAKLNLKAVVFPPVAAYSLVKAATKKKDRNAQKKIAAVRRLATAPLPVVAAVTKKADGSPAYQLPPQTTSQSIDQIQLPPSVEQAAIDVQAQALEAWQNIDAADQYVQAEEQYAEDVADSGFVEDYDSEDSIGSFYEDGALAGDAGDMSDDQIAGLLDLAKKIGKKTRAVGRLIDPTKPGSMTGSALAAIPGVGPAVKASLDLAAKAKAGSKDARDKVKTIQDLAKAGIPKAKDALKNLKVADNLQKQIERDGQPWWNKVQVPFTFATYDKGARG